MCECIYAAIQAPHASLYLFLWTKQWSGGGCDAWPEEAMQRLQRKQIKMVHFGKIIALNEHPRNNHLSYPYREITPSGWTIECILWGPIVMQFCIVIRSNWNTFSCISCESKQILCSDIQSPYTAYPWWPWTKSSWLSDQGIQLWRMLWMEPICPHLSVPAKVKGSAALWCPVVSKWWQKTVQCLLTLMGICRRCLLLHWRALQKAICIASKVRFWCKLAV